MSLDKAIANGKERRKGYAERGKPGRFDPTCRPHGGGRAHPCPWCERNRLRWRALFDEIEALNIDECFEAETVTTSTEHP